MNDFEAAGNQENPVEGFFNLSHNSHGGHPDNFDEMSEQLKSKLVGLDLFQTI